MHRLGYLVQYSISSSESENVARYADATVRIGG